MTAAGAQLVDNVWQFNGEPVRIKFIARVEDERRQIGDLVASELKDAGFEVAVNYQPFAPAVQTVYSTDPAAFEWNVYTEGWGRGAAQRYDDSTINSMNAPWMGNMPGWREQGFWQYQDPDMDALGQKLFRGQFASRRRAQRHLSPDDPEGARAPVRIWLGERHQQLPGHGRARRSRPVMSGRPRSPWTLRSAHVPG